MQPLHGDNDDAESRQGDLCIERFHFAYSILRSPALNNYDVFRHAQDLKDRPFFKLNFILLSCRPETELS
jgi:hypothetical protein